MHKKVNLFQESTQDQVVYNGKSYDLEGLFRYFR